MENLTQYLCSRLLVMRALIFLITGCFSAGLWAENKINQKTKDICQTHRVVNETTGATHVITRCKQKSLPSKQITEQSTRSGNPSISNGGLDSLNKQDLIAQQSMAQSTYWIMWLSALGLIVGALGLIFLWRTVKHSQDAAQQTRQALIENRDERCAHLVVDEDVIVTNWRVRIFLRNIGKTAATDMQFSYCLKSQSPEYLHTVYEEDFSKPQGYSFPGFLGPDRAVDGSTYPYVEIDPIYPGIGSTDFIFRFTFLDIYKKRRAQYFAFRGTPLPAPNAVTLTEFRGSINIRETKRGKLKKSTELKQGPFERIGRKLDAFLANSN